MLSIILLIIIVVVLMIGGFYLYLHNLRIPKFDLLQHLNNKFPNKEKYRVLVVYPHPDDELILMGGAISNFVKNSKLEVKVISITCGEKGDELMKVSPAELAEIRRQEFQKVMNYLGVANFETWDFPDGGLKDVIVIKKLTQKLEEETSEFIPDAIFTYEPFGFYGHPDHVALSRIITDLPTTALKIYTTISRNFFWVARKSMLPTHMADDPNAVLPLKPEYRYFAGLAATWRKLQAVKLYKSQNLRPFLYRLFAYTQEYFVIVR